MWRHVEHKNILPLLGVTPAPLQLISEWMPGGDLKEYVREYPGADRLGLVGVPPLRVGYALTPCKLRDITEGLHYLHSRDVVHGDLKGVRPYSKSR